VERYRFRDLLLLPSLLSAARLPLAVAFTRARTARAELAILGAAALTDILDGFVARKLNQATPVGALVDGTADKAFACAVVATLMQKKVLSPAAAFLLATRELFELPLALRVVVSRRAREAEVDRAANRSGKIATAIELSAVVAAIAASRLTPALLVLAGAAGALAGISYWRREIEVPARAATSLETRTYGNLPAHV
jgi:phosphatidylglycerophosphate synthase